MAADEYTLLDEQRQRQREERALALEQNPPQEGGQGFSILDPIKQAFGDDEAVRKLARQIPMNKIGDTDDVAYAVLYLASDESKFMTGAELVLDGGLSAM